ncbi:MAG: NAD(P)/FAD-dependent oxidoreductase [Rhodospirillaceae bacterium]
MIRSKIFSGPLSRRSFTAAAAGTASAALLGRRAHAFESADVIVIGAGLAGLNAALNLESEGLSVIVLEAAGYLGGRTRTFDLPIGPTNAGGQTIGPYYARVRDLATRLKVPLIPNPSRIPMGNYVNETLVASADWPNAEANKTVGPERNVQPGALEFFYLSGKNPLPDVESWTEAEQAQFDIPLENFLRNNGASDEARRLINQSINVFDLSSGSALAYLRDIKRLQWGMGDADDRTRTTYGGGTDAELVFNEIAGGTQRLPEAMAAALSGPVHLNTTVRSIDMTGTDVEVKTIDGGRYVGKYVISAVPFTALRNVDIYPNFVGMQFDAIRYSAHGNTLRVFMEFSSPFWDDIGDPGLFTDTAIERVFARTNEEGEIFGLDCWINGNAAYRLDQLPEEEVGKFVVDTLARIRPATKGKVKVVQIHSWAKHSPSGCCRHVFNAGQVGLWAGVMATPHERLHLAGEQTRSIENGMEAAAESGERAAFEIMERAL